MSAFYVLLIILMALNWNAQGYEYLANEDKKYTAVFRAKF